MTMDKSAKLDSLTVFTNQLGEITRMVKVEKPSLKDPVTVSAIVVHNGDVPPGSDTNNHITVERAHTIIEEAQQKGCAIKNIDDKQPSH